MDFILKQLNSDFSVFLILKIVVLLVLLYGFLKLGLFILKNYIIYYLAKKLAELMEAKMERDEEPPKTDREDELLRHEEKEREQEQAERVEMEVMKKKGKKGQNMEQEMEQNFKIILPKATGKWQQMVMESKKDLIFSVAKQMQAEKTMNFWQTLVKVQREQSRISGRGFNK